MLWLKSLLFTFWKIFGYKTPYKFICDKSVCKISLKDEVRYCAINWAYSCKLSLMFYLFELISIVSKTQPSCLAYFGYSRSVCSFNTLVTPANVPACWPKGYPYNYVPACGCYDEKHPGAWKNPNVACLPPIINNYAIPPCNGLYVLLPWTGPVLNVKHVCVK